MKKINSLMIYFLRFLSRHCHFLLAFSILVGFTLINSDLFARMGGAGGSSDNSSGGDGLVEAIILIFMLIPFPFNIITFGVIISFCILVSKFTKQISILNKIPSHKTIAKRDIHGIKQLELTYPNFKEQEFLSKVSKSFFDIQKAWSEKNIGIVRRYISDGMYQRVITQFKMMDILEQKNTIKDLNLINLNIEKVEADSVYDIVHVRVFASIYDTFESEKFPLLNSSTHEEFIEYWTFIRKNSPIGDKDMFDTYNCPNCGGNLEDSKLGDMSKCPYCQTITNSGDYDWVLSKITQADDYIINTKLHKLSNHLYEKAEIISNAYPDFSLQIVEDKASNGFLQLATAKVTKEYNSVKRFVTEEYHKKFINENESTAPFIYERIFLNDVSCMSISQDENQYQIILSVRFSSKKVKIADNNKLNIIDYAIISKSNYVFMNKDIDSSLNKGSIYALQCPNCGGTLSDTTDITCPYCDSLINSTKNEWIISDVLTEQEFQNYIQQNNNNFVSEIKPNKIDSLYKVRDYAFNNVLIMAAADGQIDDTELKLIHKLAKRWGYSPDKLEGLIEMAKNNHLVIRMPNNKKDITKIFKLMVKAASIDGHIHFKEEEVLNTVREEYMQN